jgi:hypothetical protein
MIFDWRKQEEEAAALARLAEVRATPAIRRHARPFGHALARALAPILKQAGPSPDTLASRWPEIVGQRLAAVTSPIRVSKGKAGGVLHLRATSAAAAMIQHAQDHIMERVNLASGSKIKSIRIVQTSAPLKVAARRPRSLGPQEREELVRSLTPLRSSSLRNALAELGESILTDPDHPPRKPPEKQ